MRTDREPVAVPATEEDPLAPLLAGRGGRGAGGGLPAKVDGIVVGRLVALAADGTPLVAIERFGVEQVPARSLQAFAEAQIGLPVALGFEGGDPGRPIVLGVMFAPEAIPAPAEAAVVREENGRVVVEAERELELRCGSAVIRLDASGRIDIRGGYINSQASATQRILGGSVIVN